MTLLVSCSKTIINLDSDHDEVLFLTEIVCKNEKNPLQSERILSSVADYLEFSGSCLVSRNIIVKEYCKRIRIHARESGIRFFLV